MRDSGAFRQALREVADAKAGGQEIANVKLISKGGAGELGDDELNAVVGGAGTVAGSPTFDKSVAYPQLKTAPTKLPGGGLPQLPGFADTTW